VHKFWTERFSRGRRPLRGVIGWLTTYFFVCAGWIFFRAQDFETAWTMLRKIAGFDPGGASWIYLPLFLLLPLVAAAHAAGWWIARHEKKMDTMPEEWVPAPALARRVYDDASRGIALRPHRAAGLYLLLPRPGFVSGFVLAVWLVGLFLFSPVHTRPFIYFQF
jgi:hypothetical protein